MLTGLRYPYEDAGGIIEDLDPFGWGATCRPLAATPATERQVLPFRTRTIVKPQQDSEEFEGAGAAQAGPAPAGLGAANRGWPSRNEVGAEGAARVARRTGSVGE
jgi:hypothetical protein